MSNQVQIRRGTATEHESFTGAEGEVTYDKTDKRLVVHDGSTSGGIPMAREDEAGGTAESIGAVINGATAKTTPVDADMFALMDSEASNVVKKFSWANLKSKLIGSINEFMEIAVSDEATAITTGTAKVTFRAPVAMTLYQIPRASLSTASSSGNPAVDINVGGSSIFSTTLTIDATEKTSTTAATAAVLGTTSIADDAEITIDIDTAGTGAKGLKVILYYRRA